MNNEQYSICDCPDYTEYLVSVKEELEAQKEQLEQVREELEHQTALLEEQIDGLSLVVNYQFTTIGVVVIFTVVIAVWKILSKWFFGGV